MELTEAIRKRRSVRRYREEPVSEELLRELLELACWAPSAENEQPWYFVALTRPEELRNLQTTMEQVAEKTKLHLEELLPKHPRIVGQTTEFLRRLGGAPVCILVFLQRDYGELRDSMLESTAAAVQTLLQHLLRMRDVGHVQHGKVERKRRFARQARAQLVDDGKGIRTADLGRLMHGRSLLLGIFVGLL